MADSLWGSGIEPVVTDEDLECSGGVYRCRDDISNFSFRVRVRKVNPVSSSLSASSLTLERGAGVVSDSNDSLRSELGSRALIDRDKDRKDEYKDTDLVEDITIQWQQKKFSKEEIKLYSEAKEEDFHQNVLKKKFFRDVQALTRRRSKSAPTNKSDLHRIYTLVDGELANLDEDSLLPEGSNLTTNEDEESNFLSILMADGLRRRKFSPNANYGGAVFDKSSIPTTNIINSAPTKDTQLRLHTLTAISQTMVVKLSINSKDTDNQSAEEDADIEDNDIELCVLKYGSNGVLEVTPDFTHNRKPYTVEVGSKSKEAYEYWIMNASPTIKQDDQLRETLMLNEVYARHAQIRRNEVGTDFEMPQNRVFRMVVYGEIVSAAYFETYELTSTANLFVHYFIDLPTGWSAVSMDHENQNETELSGITQTCRTSAIDGKDVAHFSHPFCLDLRFDINRLDQRNMKNEESLPMLPQIFFEVVSIDSWSRCRTEGYGFMSLPMRAGNYENILIDTWRPVKNGPQTEMRRYFIGGTPELEDLAYCGTPASSSDEPILSRYGFKTVSSGTLKLRFGIIHQAKAFIGETKIEKSKRKNNLLELLTTNTLFNTVSNVLQAFKQARERITKATEGYELKDNSEKQLPEA